jgi:hypothetical protein
MGSITESQPKGIEPKMSEDNKWCKLARGIIATMCKTRLGVYTISD